MLGERALWRIMEVSTCKMRAYRNANPGRGPGGFRPGQRSFTVSYQPQTGKRTGQSKRTRTITMILKGHVWKVSTLTLCIERSFCHVEMNCAHSELPFGGYKGDASNLKKRSALALPFRKKIGGFHQLPDTCEVQQGRLPDLPQSGVKRS